MKQDSMKKNSNENIFPFAAGQNDQVFTGGFFILMGIIFLLGALGITVLGHSAWVLAALIPVYWIVVVAWRRFREDGRVARRVGAVWPLGIIAVGLGMLLFGSGK